MAILTDTKAKAIKPEDKPLPHGGVTGLRLIPSKTKGHGKWELRFVSPLTGKRRDAGLGSYPEIGIASAKEKAEAMRKLVAEGIDPLEAKAREKAAPATPTFQQAAEILHKDLAPSWSNPKHVNDWINSLHIYVFKHIGAMPVTEITPKHIADVLRPFWLSKAETASRVKQRMSAVMGWAWAHGFIAANPVDVVGYLLPKQGEAARVEHFPAMPWRDVPAFVAGNLSDRQSVSANALMFLMLTAARSGEIRGAAWAEMDLDNAIWTIPAERMKMGVVHRIPLSDAAISILKAQQGQHPTLVFPSPRAAKALSDSALTMFLRKHNAHSNTGERTATAHGFRSSFRDWASVNQYPRDWAERALAHEIENKSEAAYHRDDLLEHRAVMMQAWADFLNGKASKPNNVVPLRAA